MKIYDHSELHEPLKAGISAALRRVYAVSASESTAEFERLLAKLK